MICCNLIVKNKIQHVKHVKEYIYLFNKQFKNLSVIMLTTSRNKLSAKQVDTVPMDVELTQLMEHGQI